VNEFAAITVVFSGSGMPSLQEGSSISSTPRSPKTSTRSSRIAHAAVANLARKAAWA